MLCPAPDALRASTRFAAAHGRATSPSTAAERPAVREAGEHDNHQGQQRREARRREQDQRLRGPDRQPAEHHAAARRREPARSQSAAAPAPAVSIAQSTGEPLRVSTKLWWYSSVAA